MSNRRCTCGKPLLHGYKQKDCVNCRKAATRLLNGPGHVKYVQRRGFR